ncbi:MAG: SAF domain-containing protein [Desulfovibrio sp.]|jgi:altronate dehydratase small subunit|nr:SAF domain-containing protein [Desulfovibrio sp.]
MKRVILMHVEDNVAVAAEKIFEKDVVGYTIEGRKLCLAALGDITLGFKIAVRDIVAGEAIIKYGHIIGQASSDIQAGELVHIHNVGGNRGRGDIAPDGKAAFLSA